MSIKIKNSSYQGLVPTVCPHCGKYVQPTQQNSTHFLKYEKNNIALVTFHVLCCNKVFFTTYEKTTKDTSLKLLYTYPFGQFDDLPESVHIISERFVDLYKQANAAENLNHFELAGTGYRNALEVLIKDYAINELNRPKKEVVKKKLYKAIEDYLPSIDLKNLADVVRILGNDSTHYEQRHKDIDFKTFKNYMNIFIKVIDTNYLIKHPPVSR